MTSNILVDTIEKEQIATLTFRDTETVIQNPLEIKRQLTRALVLGNSQKHKVRLIFDSDAGMKMVYTTIWGLGEEHVILKKGIAIPTDKIIEVRLI